MVWEDLEYKSKIRACFETPPHPPHPSPKSSQIRSSSLRACRLHRGQPIMASKRALADPRKPPSAPVMAQRRPQMDPRCPRDGPESAPEDPKSPPKRPLESQVASRRNHENAIEASWGLLEHTLSPRGRFEAILGSHFGAILGSSLGPKSDQKTRCFLTRFGLRFGVQNVVQIGPESSQDGLPTPKLQVAVTWQL